MSTRISNEVARQMAEANDDKPHAGLSILDQLWQKLDGAYARWRRYRNAVAALADDDPPPPVSLDFMEGRVIGLVQAIVLMSHPQTEAEIKAECLRRWKSRKQTP